MLLDSNIIIYLSQPQYTDLRLYFADKTIQTSIICKIESLGYSKLDASQKKFLENFFHSIRIVLLSEAISDKAIQLRQEFPVSLGDSIVAATCLVEKLDLVTRNISDFAMIKGLKLIDPFKIKR